jgi:hypothetical protein
MRLASVRLHELIGGPSMGIGGPSSLMHPTRFVTFDSISSYASVTPPSAEANQRRERNEYFAARHQ